MEYKDKLLQEKVDSMKQLDRIQLQNERINHGQNRLGIIIVQSLSSILMIIGILSAFYSWGKYELLRDLNLIDLSQYYLHIFAISIMIFLVYLFVMIMIALMFLKSVREYKKEINDFIEEKSK